MNKKGKNTFIVAISAMLINVVSSIIYAMIETVDLFTAFKIIWRKIFVFIQNLLIYEVKIWQIILLFFISILLILLYGKVKFNSKEKQVIPEFMNFTTGVYKGIHYKWNIVEIYYNKLKIDDFRPVCKCGAELTMNNQFKNKWFSQEKLFCVNCEKIIEENYDYEIKNDALLYFNNQFTKKIDSYNKSLKDNLTT